MPTADIDNTDQNIVAVGGCLRTIFIELGFNAILEIIAVTST